MNVLKRNTVKISLISFLFMHFIFREIKIFEKNKKMIYKINAQTPKVSYKDQNLSETIVNSCRIIYKKEVKKLKFFVPRFPVLCTGFAVLWFYACSLWTVGGSRLRLDTCCACLLAAVPEKACQPEDRQRAHVLHVNICHRHSFSCHLEIYHAKILFIDKSEVFN